MSSYVYMKILESHPRRYDRGIALLSWGHADKVKQRLVYDTVNDRSRVLDIGCGTGTAAIMAGNAGAHVTGFDISPNMLEVARENVAAAALDDQIELIEMGISGMDRFEEASFDVVFSTLAFSELSSDELTYALHHTHRILKPGGTLAIADEVRPTTVGKKLLHGVIRIPLLALTFALTQTSTHAVDGLAESVRRAGFHVESEERSNLDSFLYLMARKDEM